LFTVCPKCTLTLVVTTVDLRAGQGYVRCGRCSNVFNALIALREGDPLTGASDTAKRRLLETAPQSDELAKEPAMDPSIEPAPGVGVVMDPEPEPEPEPEVDLPAEEIVLSEESAAEPAADEISLEFDAAATDVSEIFISPPEAEHDTASGNYEAVILQVEPPPAPSPVAEPADDEPLQVDPVTAHEWSLLDDDEPAADAESVIEESPLTYGGDAPEDAADDARPATPSDPAWVEQMFAEAEAQAHGRISRSPARRATDVGAGNDVVENDDPGRDDDHNDDDALDAGDFVDDATPRVQTQPSDATLAPLFGTPASQRPSWHYVAGVAGLVLLFGLQVAHFNRQSIAVSPTFGPLASTIYGWFHATLTPRWDLTAYSVRQLGAESEDAEGTRLRVRVSLHNESTRVQPFPLLRLTLSDRFGNPVATRDLEPADYLPKKFANERLLEPDQRIDAEVHVLDPAKAAMGFVIDACLRASNGNIGCAADARAKSRAAS
jgi:predicted Zn finger-like uncharacterized protein